MLVTHLGRPHIYVHFINRKILLPKLLIHLTICFSLHIYIWENGESNNNNNNSTVQHFTMIGARPIQPTGLSRARASPFRYIFIFFIKYFFYLSSANKKYFRQKKKKKKTLINIVFKKNKNKKKYITTIFMKFEHSYIKETQKVIFTTKSSFNPFG